MDTPRNENDRIFRRQRYPKSAYGQCLLSCVKHAKAQALCFQLSERVQTILPQHADSLDSPLRRKSRTLYHKTQTAPSSFVSTISDSIFSKPLTRNPSYELLPPVAKLLGIDDPHIRSVVRSIFNPIISNLLAKVPCSAKIKECEYSL